MSATLLAAVAVALCLAVPAGATLKFGTPRTLTPAGTAAFRPHVAYDGQGRATVAWMINSEDPGCSACRRIQAVRLSSDGTPATIHTLSPADEDASESEPQVAVDSQGRATVVWAAEVGANYRVKAVRLGVDGMPGPVQTLSAAGGDAVFPKLAVDSQDRVTVAWYRNDGSTYRVQATRIAADGSPGPVQTLSQAGGDAADPSLAIDFQDRATIVWTRYDGTQYRAQQVRLDGSGNPGAVHTLSAAGGNASLPQVAVGSQGQARVVWEWDTFALGGENIFLQSASLDANELVGAVQVIDGAIVGNTGARVAIDSQGRTQVVWQGSLNGNFRAKARPIGADGFLGAGLFLSPTRRDGGQPQIAFDSKDRAVVTFYSDDGSNNRIELARLEPDGTASAVQTLSEGGGNAGYPQLALDSLDGAAVVWDRRDSGDTLRVQVARGQTAAPDTKITRGPHNHSTLLKSSVKFSFASGPGAFAGHFQCSLDGRAFADCSSPVRLKRLRDGRHDFRVRAVDEDGTDASPAVRRFIEAGNCSAKARSSQRSARARGRCRGGV